jgi:hypothetical protein
MPSPGPHRPRVEQLEVPDPEDLLIFGRQDAVQPTPRAGARLAGNQQPWKLELEHYLVAPKAAMSSDILKWWDIHELKYPHLAKVARDYAGIPGSSVPRYAETLRLDLRLRLPLRLIYSS